MEEVAKKEKAYGTSHTCTVLSPPPEAIRKGLAGDHRMTSSRQPYLYGHILPCRSNVLAIGRPHSGPYHLLVSTISKGTASASGIPYLYRAVNAGRSDVQGTCRHRRCFRSIERRP